MTLTSLSFFIAGLILLITGAELSVRGTSKLAALFGISPLVIGLTIAAFGTSSPELAVSFIAALSGNADISLGNVVGSNIFNILAVLGLSGIATTDGIRVSPNALYLDIPVMIAVAVICLPVFMTHKLISRWEGMILLGCYVVYIAYLTAS